MGEQETKKRVSFSLEPDDVALLPPVTLEEGGTDARYLLAAAVQQQMIMMNSNTGGYGSGKYDNSHNNNNYNRAKHTNGPRHKGNGKGAKGRGGYSHTYSNNNNNNNSNYYNYHCNEFANDYSGHNRYNRSPPWRGSNYPQQASTWSSSDGTDRGAAVRWLTAVTASS